jgi:hypothetical protein
VIAVHEVAGHGAWGLAEGALRFSVGRERDGSFRCFYGLPFESYDCGSTAEAAFLAGPAAEWIFSFGVQKARAALETQDPMVWMQTRWGWDDATQLAHLSRDSLLALFDRVAPVIERALAHLADRLPEIERDLLVLFPGDRLDFLTTGSPPAIGSYTVVRVPVPPPLFEVA